MTEPRRNSFVPWEVELIERAHLLRREIEDLKRLAGADNPQFSVASAQQMLDNLETDLLEGEQVSIALLGGTGSGKSTLLNALLGARLVPTSSMKACTSVITKARWSEEPGYSATVHFVPRESWRRQVDHLAADISMQADPEVEDHGGVSEALAIPKDDQDRLRAVYGDENTETFMRSGDVSLLSEPETIRAAFAEGSHQIRESDLEIFRAKIKGYLDSSEHYWPIVQSVEISGPFEALRCGGEIVDLPGLNDPNEAREATTRAYLENAKFIWVVFNMKRNLTKEMTDTLRSRDLLGRLLAGGRLATITLVGTASDDIDPESDCEALGLDDDAPIDEIVSARNARSVEIARDQLLILAKGLSTSGSDDEELSDLTNSLLASPVLTVSARDYLALKGITRSKTSISTEAMTGIPDLCAHFERITTEAGPWTRAVRAFARLEVAVDEIALAVQQERAHFELSTAAAESEREAIAAALEAAGAEFTKSSASVLARLGRSLQLASQRFDSTLKAGAEAAVSSLGRVTAGWSHIHWATLRATSVRGGTYASPTFGQIDLVQQVSTPILDKAISPWIEFYDRELVEVFEEANGELATLVVEYAAAVGQVAEQQQELAASVLTQLQRLIDDVTRSVESSLALLRSSFATDVNQQRQLLHRLTYDNVSKSLASAFAQAGRERGTGMKFRMLDTIGTAVQRSARAEYDKVAAILLTQVNASAGQVHAKLAEAVADVVAKADDVSAGLRRVALQPVKLDDRWIVSIEERVDRYPDRFLTKLDPPKSLLKPQDESDQSPKPDHSAARVEAQQGLRLVLVDGSNVCASPGKGPDMERLRSAIQAAERQWPERTVITVVDRSMGRYLESRGDGAQASVLQAMIDSSVVIEPPPGHPGKADTYLLMLASDSNGVVLSNDSFKEYQHMNQWLSEPDRLFGYTFHPTLGWKFTPRFVVKQRTRGAVNEG